MQQKIFFLLIILLFWNVGYSQEFNRAVTIGGTDNDYARAVITDENGNVYTTGFFLGTVDFDAGSGTTSLTSAGGFDVFILKTARNGKFRWVRQIGSTGTDACYSLGLDKKGHIYAAGRFEGTVDFDPGSGTNYLKAAGSADAFIQKMDTSGNFKWAAAMGGTSFDQPTAISVDDSGNVFSTGIFSGKADFDPGSGSYFLTSSGDQDIFIQKLNPNGRLAWAQSIGNTGADRGYSITLDQDLNIYATGIFSGTVDFNPGTGTTNLSSAGFFDFFVLKLDSAGKFKWANSSGGASYDFAWDITTDKDNNIYTTGYFSGTADFNPGTGTYYLSPTGSYDVFIQKTDSNGNFLWAKSFGGKGDDRGYSIEVDDSSSIYLTGYYQQTADFDPGSGTFDLTVAGASDFYLLKLDTAGIFDWAGSMGGNGTGGDFGLGLTLDDKRSIYIVGNYDGTADFNPDTLITNSITSNGGSDAFILKFKQCKSFTSQKIVACDSFLSPRGTLYYTKSGKYTDTLINSEGCDSIVFTNLVINSTFSITANQTLCANDSIFLGGKFRNNSGIYYDTFTAITGCDSVIITTLKINPIFSLNLNASICSGDSIFLGGEYRTSAGKYMDTLVSTIGCDSIIITQLNLLPGFSLQNPVSICHRDSFYAGNAFQHTPGIYYDTFKTYHGCDSIIQTTLSVTMLDTSVRITDSSLIANDTSASYRWLDCNNNYSPVTGANSKEFMPLTTGVYAVEIQKNGCTDTSNCYSFLVTDLDNKAEKMGISVFPNPASSILYLYLPQLTGEITLELISVEGKEEIRRSYSGKKVIALEIHTIPSGLYILKMVVNGKGYYRKIIKE